MVGSKRRIKWEKDVGREEVDQEGEVHCRSKGVGGEEGSVDWRTEWHRRGKSSD